MSTVAVCFIVDRLYRGGTELLILRLIAGLDRSRFSPSLVLLEAEPHDPTLGPALDCPVLRLGVRRVREPRFLPAALRLAAFLRRHRVEVLQLHHPTPTAVGLVATLLAPRTRLVRTRFNLGYWMTPSGRRLERMAARRADATVANCEAARAVLLQEALPTPGAVVVIANGIETERLAALPPPPPASDRPRIGLLANLRPIKDPERFVRAAALLASRWPLATFEIAGEGELRADLLELASRLGLGTRLRLHGAVADGAGFLAGLDVAVLCSLSEGLPNALLEYMAAGRPIVATAVGGVPEAVRDDREGLLVPAGDQRALAEAIARLLTDSVLAARLGAAARARGLAVYPMSATLGRFSALYRALASTPQPTLRRARPQGRARMAAAIAASYAAAVPEPDRGGGGRSPVEA